MTAPSAKNKSENSNALVPNAAPSEASGTNAVVAVIVVPCIVAAATNAEPSNVKFASPFNVVPPVAVKTLLFVLLATVAPAATQDNTPEPSVVNCCP